MTARGKMPALVFDLAPLKLARAKLRGLRGARGRFAPGGPLGLRDVPRPAFVADDWVIVRTVLSGICGSDLKEATLDGALDNPIRSLISFPQVMGHEVVGVVEEAGLKATRVKPGDRVAVNPWFPCRPRGIEPECPRCKAGDYTHCHNFRRGNLPPGMHLGVTRGFGGFAPLVAVHDSQCFAVPEGVPFEAAVLADPFSVAFHACLLLDPAPDQLVLVYGLGVIGLAAILCLKRVFGVRRVVAVGRHPFQKDLALSYGAERVFESQGLRLVEEVAAFTGAELYTPERGSKWMIDGVDGVVDTIATAATLEAGMRFLRSQGRLVFPGVATPRRCENTPHYFKELEVIGSNAFAVEEFAGRRAHAFDFYMDFIASGRIDPAPLVTHRFPLSDYARAFETLADRRGTGAVKVVFRFD